MNNTTTVAAPAPTQPGARPLTLEDVIERGLFAKHGDGIHTFSNGSHYEGWAAGNCFGCQYYELDGSAGELCGFEGAALLGGVSPALATLFGWTQDPKYAEHDGGRHGWDEPKLCPFFRGRDEAPLPFVDPDQIGLGLAIAASPAQR